VVFLLSRGGGGLENEEPPEIVGDPAVLQAVTADPGVWSEDDVSFEFQWQRCDRDGEGCEAIDGATAPTFTSGADEINLTLRVQVTAAAPDDEDDTATATSDATAAIPAPDLNSVAVPDVFGLPQSQAVAALSADFVVQIERDDSLPATECDPSVVQQRPGGGTLLQRGESVTLITAPQVINIRACLPIFEGELRQPIRVIDDPFGPIREDVARLITEELG
jgi:hypothetical protein